MSVQKFKSITVGTSYGEGDEEYCFVVFADADMVKMMTDQNYALNQVVCQPANEEWGTKIAAALNAAPAAGFVIPTEMDVRLENLRQMANAPDEMVIVRRTDLDALLNMVAGPL